jgi:hypothetical protein
MIMERGDGVVPIVIQAGYLVIGATVIGTWRYGTHDLKVHEGVELIEYWCGLAIVSETH